MGVTFHEKVRVAGWPACLAWEAIHLYFLIGFRNRASVMLQWAYYFVTWRRRVRLITGGSSEALLPAPHVPPSAARALRPSAPAR